MIHEKRFAVNAEMRTNKTKSNNALEAKHPLILCFWNSNEATRAYVVCTGTYHRKQELN